MKRILSFLAVLIFATLMVSAASAASKAQKCTTLQEGKIKYSATHYLAGQPIKPGYDIYGYNYQAHMFNGSYVNVYLGGDGFPPYEGDDAAYLAANPTVETHWAWPYRDAQIIMKWNDAWISNKDCGTDGVGGEPDGKLDRHYGYPTYIGSGAWETNHQSGTYEQDGKTCNWNYFVKIVAVPASAKKVAGVWYAADGTEIGPDLWGEFATIQDVYNDACAGYGGVSYKSPASPGFGFYKP